MFCASASTSSPQRIKRILGNNQTGAQAAVVEHQAPHPLLTQVFDTFGNPVEGIDVTYAVLAGGGHFDGQPTAVATTGIDGKASAVFTLGAEAGLNNHLVEASFAGLTESTALFVYSGVAPSGDDTRLDGLVLDNEDQPVPGATVTLEGTELSALTDEQGRFALTGAPVGTVHLVVDGSTTPRPGTWAKLSFELVTIQGHLNTIGMPIRLLPLDEASARVVGGSQDVTIPMTGVPGAEITVFAGSTTFPDGSRVGEVSLTQVHGDKVPMVAPMGSSFMLAWTVQPPGTRFDPPARIAIPNFGAEPGTVVDIFSFDHDLGEFVIAGTAAVTADARQLVSTPGSGVSKAGWHGCIPPPPPDADSCHPGLCSICLPGRKRPVPKCDECEVCNNGICDPKTLGEVTAAADDEEEEALAGDDKPIDFSARLESSCQEPEFEWDFGDGTYGDGANTSHAYEEPGRYTAQVTVSCGECPAVEEKSDTVEVIVVKADVELQNLPEVGAPSEDSPGAFLPVPQMGKEPNLVPLTVKLVGEGADRGELRLGQRNAVEHFPNCIGIVVKRPNIHPHTVRE